MTFTSDDLAVLKQQLMTDEGLRLRPYVDTAGKLTIGFGHNLTDKGITRAQADLLLDDDLADAMNAVFDKIHWAQTLDAPRLQVLVNIAFNAGIDGLLDFRRMLAAMEVRNFSVAAQEVIDSKLPIARARRLAGLLVT